MKKGTIWLEFCWFWCWFCNLPKLNSSFYTFAKPRLKLQINFELSFGFKTVQAIMYYTSIIKNSNLVLKNRANESYSKTADSVARISSGTRIPAARFDPSGLAISKSMNRYVSSINQGMMNMQQGSTFISVAVGGLTRITDVLDRMRTLAVTASTDVMGPSERSFLQEEFSQMTNTIDSIVEGTRFSKQGIFDKGETVTLPGDKGKQAIVFATNDTFDVFNITKTNEIGASRGLIDYVGGKDIFSIDGEGTKLTVNLGGQIFQTDYMDVQQGGQIFFKEVSGENHFALSVTENAADFADIDTQIEFKNLLTSFFTDADTIIKVGVEKSNGKNWLEYGESIANTASNIPFVGGAGAPDVTYDDVKSIFTSDSIQASKTGGPISGEIFEVGYGHVGDTDDIPFISINIEGETFVTGRNSFDYTTLQSSYDAFQSSGGNNLEIVLISQDNSDRTITWDVRPEIWDVFERQHGANSPDTLFANAGGNTIPNAAQAEQKSQILDAFGVSLSVALGTQATRYQVPGNSVTYTREDPANAGQGYENLSFSAGKPAGMQRDTSHVVAGFMTTAAVGSPMTFNTQKSSGHFSGLAESVNVTHTGGSTYDIEVVIGGRLFRAIGASPTDSPTASAATYFPGAANSTVSDLQINRQSEMQTLDLFEVGRSKNRIAINYSTDASTVLDSESVFQNSLERLLGVGDAGASTSSAYFQSSGVTYSGTHGFSGEPGGGLSAAPGVVSGNYSLTYDEDEKVFTLTNGNTIWDAKATDQSIGQFVVFGNGLSFELGYEGNEFNSNAALGQIAFEIERKDTNIKEFQVSGQVDDVIAFEMPGISAEKLGIIGVSLQSIEGAKRAQDIIGRALTGINQVIATLGAEQAGAENTLRQLATNVISSKQSISVLSDIDFGAEMIAFTKASVLSQAATSMLSQSGELFGNINRLIDGMSG